MKTTSDCHPSEDLLEEFARNRCSDQETELVETHVLACEICIAKLEDLDDFLAALRPGYELLLQNRSRRSKIFSRWWAFGFASATALALMLCTMPSEFSHTSQPPVPVAQLQLSAERGIESANAPAFRPLRVYLSAADLPPSMLIVEVVSSVGSPVWNGSTQVAHDSAIVNLPPMPGGEYFLRLYSTSKEESNLLREFAFEIK